MHSWQRIDDMDAETARRTAYEPWRPRPGDRVRIRLNGECEHRYKFAGIAGGPPVYATGVPHRLELENGRLGRVIESQQWATDEDVHAHVYMVLYDDPIPTPWLSYGQDIAGQAYAAIELEQVETDGGNQKYERR